MDFLKLILSPAVLLTTSFWALIYVFRAEIKEAIKRGGILVEWGDKKVSLKEATEKLDSETTVLGNELEGIINRIDALEKASDSSPVTFTASSDHALVKKKLEHALSHSKYTWRSIRRLSNIAGVSEADVSKILKNESTVTVKFIESKGEDMAALTSRL